MFFSIEIPSSLNCTCFKGFLSTLGAFCLYETECIHALLVETVVSVNVVLKQAFKLYDRIVMTCGNELLTKREYLMLKQQP